MFKNEIIWLIIRTIGIGLFCLSLLQFYEVIEKLIQVYNVWDYSSENEYRQDKISNFWQALRELTFLIVLTHYFLKNGIWVFKKLSIESHD
jgi:hypothetical protein